MAVPIWIVPSRGRQVHGYCRLEARDGAACDLFTWRRTPDAIAVRLMSTPTPVILARACEGHGADDHRLPGRAGPRHASPTAAYPPRRSTRACSRSERVAKITTLAAEINKRRSTRDGDRAARGTARNRATGAGLHHPSRGVSKKGRQSKRALDERDGARRYRTAGAWPGVTPARVQATLADGRRRG